MAHIAVDYKYVLSFDGKGHCCVQDAEGLSASRVERCEYNHILLVVSCNELDVCSQHAECLIDGIA